MKNAPAYAPEEDLSMRLIVPAIAPHDQRTLGLSTPELVCRHFNHSEAICFFS